VSRSRLRSLALGVAAVLACAAVGLVVRGALDGSSGSGGGAGAGGRTTGTLPVVPVSADTRFSAAAAQSRAVPEGATLIATARTTRVRIYPHARGGAHGTRLLQRRVFHGQPIPLTFRVRDRRPGWVRVDLPTRPNHAVGWVRPAAVRFTTTRMHVTVDLRRHQLTLRDGKSIILKASVGLGRSVSPTPHGTAFVTDLIRPSDPKGFYGPYALGLSVHSSVYTSFEGGDGQIGIHGTNRPSALGRDVSHGCIRVRNATMRRLARSVPLGTPVLIR
jgi:lipoprotein-anchoring transpeptidase ErfK/SrfK